MVRDPGLNDRALARSLGARPTTVTAARGRLERRGIVYRKMVPSLLGLGATVLSVAYGTGPSGRRLGTEKAIRKAFSRRGCAGTFLALSGPAGWLEIGAYRDYSSALADQDTHPFPVPAKRRGESPMPSSTRQLWPLEFVELQNWFDHSRLLGELFGTCGAPKARPGPAATGPARLTPMESLVIYGLVREPERPEVAVAETLGVSRQSVSRIGRSLVGRGLLSPRVMVRPERLGFELSALLHFRLAEGLPPGKRRAALANICDSLPHTLALSAGRDCLVLATYRRFSGLERGLSALAGRLEGGGLLEGAPAVVPFLLEDTMFARDHDFSPLVKAVLGQDIED